MTVARRPGGGTGAPSSPGDRPALDNETDPGHLEVGLGDHLPAEGGPSTFRESLPHRMGLEGTGGSEADSTGRQAPHHAQCDHTPTGPDVEGPGSRRPAETGLLASGPVDSLQQPPHK